MSEAVADQNTCYSSIKENPKSLLKFVNKFVKVSVIKNCSYVGFVHSIDPVTHSIILSVPQEETYQTVIIPGHAVFGVAEEELPANVNPPQRKESHTESTEDIMKRKAQLISWFKTNLLPVTELEDKIVIGNVTLLHPYNITDICTDNPIVAMQIRNVIEKMPEQF